MNLQDDMIHMAQSAKEAALKIATIPTSEKNKALKLMAQDLIAQADFIYKSNEKDLAAARDKGYAKALVDRLVVDKKQLKEMADSLF